MLINRIIEGIYTAKDHINRNPRMKGIVERVRNKRYFTDLEIHDRMLADSTRVDAYYQAIKKYVSEKDVVIDLGTGTGILSFFAAQQGAKRIYALDHSEIIDMAKFLAAENNIENVSFLQVHSTEFMPDEKASIVLHEQMGSELFNEYMIANVCDLRDRVLAKGGKILPAKFELYLEPVSLKDEYRMPYLWERDIHGVRLGAVKDWLKAKSKTPNGPRISTQRRMMPLEVDFLLCTPETIYSFDLYTASPEPMSCVWRQSRRVVRDGRIDGFCLYFKAFFDDEISISTSPLGRRTSWNGHLFRTEGIELKEGQTLDIEWAIGDLSNVRSWVPTLTTGPVI